MKRSELIGEVFGRLTVLGLSEISRNGHSRWHVKCECGTEKTVLGTHLVQKKIRSCGCLHFNHHKGQFVKGHRGNFKGYELIPLSYFSSVKRGANGGKGRKPIEFNLTIKDMWEVFTGKCVLSSLPIDFKSRTASLDRIDSSKGYIKENIQWLHKDVNMMKRHYNQEYFMKLCKLIAESK